MKGPFRAELGEQAVAKRPFRKTAGQFEVPVDGPLGLGRVPDLLAEEVDGPVQAARMQRPCDREVFIADQALVDVAGGEAEEAAEFGHVPPRPTGR